MSHHSNGGADLHLHTSHSDGTFSPEELVALARKERLQVIALTDHDSMEGVLRARRAAGPDGVEVVAGVEFGTPADDGRFPETHVVGLFLDPSCDELCASLKTWRALRRERVLRMVGKLNQCGVAVQADDVFAVVGTGSPSRLHVARAMAENGCVRTIGAAFRHWIGLGGPAYIPRQSPPAPDLVRLIHRAGGVAVLAHPAINVKDEEIPMFVEAGIDGIEAYCTYHTPADVERYEKLAERLGLLVSGGSDCHGANKTGCTLGSVRLDLTRTEMLRERAMAYAEGRRHV